MAGGWHFVTTEPLQVVPPLQSSMPMVCPISWIMMPFFKSSVVGYGSVPPTLITADTKYLGPKPPGVLEASVVQSDVSATLRSSRVCVPSVSEKKTPEQLLPGM